MTLCDRLRQGGLGCLAAISLAAPGWADSLRIASFNTELSRDGPGLLLRDLTRDKEAQIAAVVAVIARISPDILALQSVDWDYDGAALAALAARLTQAGADYPYRMALRPNSGMATDLDMDGDGRRGGPGDAQGFGAFSGQGGLAILSRYPILGDRVRDFSDLLWRDLSGALLPEREDGSPFPSPEAQAIQRLSTTGHWIVPVALPDGSTVQVLTFHATPPVFDGDEDQNGRRNHDEILLWRAVLDGAFGPPPQRFVLAGQANLDPQDSEGRLDAIRGLLADPRLQDPRPASEGAAAAPDQGHASPNALDTVDWQNVGRLRVDYVLPSADWRVIDSGVFWPATDSDGHSDAIAASRHRLVWVDLDLD
ncbi:endonuclease/exonuclease/phosphatase family protein [Sedimentitalea nanhaiensis]|uniref:Metal-dependent hydrolase, endonuclease/exonuclease/phosphatase family n=1 Tax=Sedimentitalea nanhaiensis TaxID=999627 RepID=A0A1I7DTU0_9RHOB|nr:endonuclease/exonuclease/phosphatase family protein [Sedimentitalea nanhaiensis]SFU15108.1 Metal-dependent hydrolase, endonuclease/exonuclease/phosphatase family [Sedimentitalea nanhaiensis]